MKGIKIENVLRRRCCFPVGHVTKSELRTYLRFVFPFCSCNCLSLFFEDQKNKKKGGNSKKTKEKRKEKKKWRSSFENGQLPGPHNLMRQLLRSCHSCCCRRSWLLFSAPAAGSLLLLLFFPSSCGPRKKLYLLSSHLSIHLCFSLFSFLLRFLFSSLLFQFVCLDI